MFYIAVDPPGSRFAKTLQQALQEQGIRAIRASATRGLFHESRGKKVFYVTQNALNKVQQFERFAAGGVASPPFTTDRNKVGELGAKVVYARTLVNSTGGKGIVEVDISQGEVPPAPLYTAYIPKKREFRVHVFDGEVIDIQQKRKRQGSSGNSRIRNLANGYVYCRDNLESVDGLETLAVSAVAAVGYRYGAVDIIWNEMQNKCYVLEVNSRPGLEGTTVVKYADTLRECYEG